MVTGQSITGHARIADLALFIRGRLTPEKADALCEHVIVCEQCEGEFQQIAELLWPSLSIWIKCWLRVLSPSWPPARVLNWLAALRLFGPRRPAAVKQPL